MGSTWRHPNGAEIEAGRVYDLPPGSYGRDDEGTSTGELTPGWFGRNQMSKEDINRINQEFSIEGMMNRKPLMDKPDWMPDWGVDAGIIAAGVLGGGRNPGSKNAMWQSMKNMGTRLKDSKLMDKLFKSNKKQYNKDGSQKNVPGEPIYKNVRPNWNTKLKQWEFRGKKIDPQTWNGGKGVNSTQRVRVGTNPKLDPKGNPIPVTARDWSKWQIGTGAAIPGAAGIQALMSSLSGKKDEEEAKKNAFINKSALENERLMEIEAYGGPRGSSAPEQKQTAMQKLGANMKNPEWWHQSMSGLPSDTRLMRLGQLMDYYGKTPKGRKEKTAPSELWAANEVAHGKNVAAATDKPDSYKWSYKNVNEALSEWYDDKFGTDWWGGKDGDKLKNKFMNDVTDEKARYPTKNLKQIAEQLLKEYPEEYL
jgi:hypothetical protein